jgi:hypothetical protein
MSIRDNQDTSPDLILSRVRAGRRQATLNIELALSNKQNVTANAGASSAGSGSTSGGNIVADVSGSGGSGGGGYVYCFSGSTQVLIPGGSRPIFSIPCGISIAAPDDEGQICEGKVIGRTERFYSSFLEVTFADGRRTEVRPKHRYRNEHGEYIPIEEATYSMRLKDGNRWVKMMIIDKVERELDIPRLFYNLEIEDFGAYVANGDWVSNRKIDTDLL